MELRSVFTYCRLFLCDVISQDVPIVSAVCSDVHACEPTKFTRSLIIGLNSFSFLCCITSCISSALNLHSLLMYASRSSSFQEYTYINQVFIYEVSKQHEYRNYIPYMVFSYYINSTYIALHFTLVYSSDLLSILQVMSPDLQVINPAWSSSVSWNSLLKTRKCPTKLNLKIEWKSS